MGIKTITSIALAVGSVACIAASPALANNNDKYLNQMAMQMYLQNQSAAYNPYLYNNYGAYSYGGQTPWSAGAMPYAYGSRYNTYGRYNAPRAYYHHGW